FRNRVDESLVISRLMSCNRRHNRRHDILWTTMLGKEDFDAGPGRFRRFDEDEFVLVGQDHRTWANAPTLIARDGDSLRPLRECMEPWIAAQRSKHSIDLYTCRIG